jgi:hypothetical protein
VTGGSQSLHPSSYENLFCCRDSAGVSRIKALHLLLLPGDVDFLGFRDDFLPAVVRTDVLKANKKGEKIKRLFDNF